MSASDIQKEISTIDMALSDNYELHRMLVKQVEELDRKRHELMSQLHVALRQEKGYDCA